MRHTCLVAVAAIILAGCATGYTPAPTDAPARDRVGQIRLINDQADSKPQPLLSGGVAPVMTNYKGWTNIIISRFQDELTHHPRGSTKSAALRFSIRSIRCSGTVVIHCALALQVERGDGQRAVYTTPARSGYPVRSALDKAIDDAVRQALADPKLTAYLAQQSY